MNPQRINRGFSQETRLPTSGTKSISTTAARPFSETSPQYPEPKRCLVVAFWCDREVINGGFQQLFWNSTGVVVPEAPAAYRALGLDSAAVLLRNPVLSPFSATVPPRLYDSAENVHAVTWGGLPVFGPIRPAR